MQDPLLSQRSRFASHAYVYNMKDVVMQSLFENFVHLSQKFFQISAE